MKLRTLLILVPLVLAAACSKGGDGSASNASAAASAPAAAVAPPAGQNWTQVVAKTPEGGVRMGNPNAPVKLIEYGSRTCPVCGMFGRTGMQPLETQYVATGKVSYEFRDYLVHAPDLGVALLGECVPTEAFFPVLEAMYQGQEPFLDKLEKLPDGFQQKLQSMTPQQQATAWVDYLGYVTFMQQHGLPEPAARACLVDQTKVQQVAGITDDAMNNQNVMGTPTFFVNGQQATGVVTWQQLESALKAAGA